nr:gluconokinase [Corynebacterium heidelbergense]
MTASSRQEGAPDSVDASPQLDRVRCEDPVASPHSADAAPTALRPADTAAASPRSANATPTAPAAPTPIHLVLMGVSGCGKTSVATLIHERLGYPYAEADEFHPPANKQKMASGQPLTDEDRWPWLTTLRDWMTSHARAGESTIVTCSALKRAYRSLLSDAEGRVFFIHLAGPMQVIADRMSQRTGHFMPTSLLPSQYADLQPLAPGEDGVTLNVLLSQAELAEEALLAAGLLEDANTLALREASASANCPTHRDPSPNPSPEAPK